MSTWAVSALWRPRSVHWPKNWNLIDHSIILIRVWWTNREQRWGQSIKVFDFNFQFRLSNMFVQKTKEASLRWFTQWISFAYASSHFGWWVALQSSIQSDLSQVAGWVSGGSSEVNRIFISIRISIRSAGFAVWLVNCWRSERPTPPDSQRHPAGTIRHLLYALHRNIIRSYSEDESQLRYATFPPTRESSSNDDGKRPRQQQT